ncbi:MAG: Ig-like domain-containing protein [Thermoplasmata archaeon]|nr:Ig-like domain-containing protein [Thermoplasmata archaeon]
MNLKAITVLVAAVMAIAGVAVVIGDESDGASTYTARVYIDDGGSTVELSGTGSTVKQIVQNALTSAGHNVVMGSRTVTSVDGIEAGENESWTVQQWLPPRGWQVILFTSASADANLAEGTAFYVYLSDVTTDEELYVSYSSPSYEPQSTAYFFIKFVEDVNANSYVTSLLSEEERLAGFWISGTGSSAAEAFSNACSTYGLELNMSDGVEDGKVDVDYIGWLYSFLGLGDVGYADGTYKYWSQFYYDSANSKWVYGETLGHYDPAVVKYFALIRQITEEDNVSTNLGIDLTSVPVSNLENGCTVTFVDGDGNVVKTQHVSYLGTATPPSTATKSASGTTTYVFSGWDGDYTQVMSDTVVTATFTTVGTSAVTGVSITDTTSTMRAGTSYQLTATVLPMDSRNKSVSWSSSDTSVATVSTGGLVTGVAAGTVTITVVTAEGGYSDSVTITVRPAAGSAESVSLSATSVILQAGESVTLTATVSPSDAVNKSVSWSSSDTSVATVSSTGAVTAVSPGSATITVTTSDGGYTAICKVRVYTEENIQSLMEDDQSGIEGDEFTSSVSQSQAALLNGSSSGFTLTTDIGSVSLSSDVVASLSSGFSLTVALYDHSGLSSAQSKAVGDRTVYQYLVNGSDSADLGGTATVTMPYTLADGESAADLKVYCVDWNGSVEAFDCTYDASAGTVTFQTTHFSLYFATAGTVESGGSDGGSDNTAIYIAIAAVVVIAAIAAVVLVKRR